MSSASEARRDSTRLAPDMDATRTNGKPRSKDKSRDRSMNGTLDGWVEPAVATAKPSFDDHGGAPFGVLEHMQPLGEAPNARVRARVKGDGARKSMLGRSAAGAGVEAQETPEGTPGPPLAMVSPVKVEPEGLPQIVIDDENDDDYAPTVKKAKKKEVPPKPVKVAKRQSDVKPAAPPAKAKQPKVNTNQVYGARKLKNVVEEAKKRALDVNKPDLAAAVNEIYLDSLTDAHLTSIMENILLQNATPEQTAEFHSYVRKAKKKLRAAKQASTPKAGRSLPEQEANGSSKSLPLRSPVKPEADATKTSNIMPAALPSVERSEPPKPKLSLKVRAQSKPTDRPQENAAPVSSSKHRSEELDAMSDVSELTELSEGDHMEVDTPGPRQPASFTGTNGHKLEDQAAERGSLGVHSRGLKRSSADADMEDTDDERELAAKKQKFSSAITRDHRYEESSVRDSTQPLRGAGTRNGAVVPPKIKLQHNGIRNASGMGSRAVSTDVDSPLSSPALSSKRGTPHVWKGPLKPSGKRAKTKTSPTKKPQAGDNDTPGNGGASRASPIRDDDNEELSDNNDFCSSCGGSGFLLCCDGCDRSFHFTCLDPPINNDASELNEPWFCFKCVAKRPISTDQPEQSSNRLFGKLLGELNKKNPVTFSLPSDIKQYYAGVAEDKDGSFTAEPVKLRQRNRAGYDERPDDYRLKDSKGDPVICFFCTKSSGRVRPIITCDTCATHWHLDCLDPPLANAPGRDPSGAKTSEWMCPLHVDHDLKRIKVESIYRHRRTINVRRPRLAQPTETSLARGHVNNGNIEIRDEESESEFESDIDEDVHDQAVIPKLPAKGIILDFAAKIKQARSLATPFERPLKRPRMADYDAAGLAMFSSRSLRDQQAALFMAQMAQRNPSFGLDSDQVEGLIHALVSEAPENVLASEDREPAPQKPKPSREALLRLQRLLNEALLDAI